MMLDPRVPFRLILSLLAVAAVVTSCSDAGSPAAARRLAASRAGRQRFGRLFQGPR